MPWIVSIAILEIISGAALFKLSLTNRWVNWCLDKPFVIPYFCCSLSVLGNYGRTDAVIDAVATKMNFELRDTTWKPP